MSEKQAKNTDLRSEAQKKTQALHEGIYRDFLEMQQKDGVTKTAIYEALKKRYKLTNADSVRHIVSRKKAEAFQELKERYETPDVTNS